MNILITGVGGPAGICFGKSLSEIEGVNLIGANAEEDSVGRKFVKNFYILPFANNPNFISKINEIISKENIDFLIPLVDEELMVVAENLDKIKCKALISPKETLELTTNKAKLYEKLKEFLPKRFDKENSEFPLFVKPAVGRGGRDTHIVKSKEELDKFNSDYVFQEILKSPEYTVDTLFDFEGNPLIISPRVRSKVESGISVSGKIILNEEIISKVKAIAEKMKFVGPINFQFMDSDKGVKLMEINARSSGGMGITINSGIDIPKLTYQLLNGGVNLPQIKEGEFDNFEEIIERQRLKMEAMKC